MMSFRPAKHKKRPSASAACLLFFCCLRHWWRAARHEDTRVTWTAVGAADLRFRFANLIVYASGREKPSVVCDLLVFLEILMSQKLLDLRVGNYNLDNLSQVLNLLKKQCDSAKMVIHFFSEPFVISGYCSLEGACINLCFSANS